jgi:hypothetical protein
MDPRKETDSLSTTLAAWRVAAPRDPQFRRQVWARLGGGVGPVPWRVFARRHFALVGGSLALALAVGAFTGHERARSRVAAESARMAAAYVQGLDARLMPMP